MSAPDELLAKLMLLGGTQSTDQLFHDPDCELIFRQGYIFEGPPIIIPEGNQHHCHWNISKLYRDGRLNGIVIGYALWHDIWFQHTWGLKDNRIVETFNAQFIIYFGVRLEDPLSFVKWCEQNPPGSKKVRYESLEER